MTSGGLGALMLPLAIAGIVLTGLPAFAVLIGVAIVFAALGTALGVFDPQLLGALPVRLVGLLEHDLLQALALYALVGALLHRLQLAERWLATAERWLARTGAGPELAAIGLGTLTAPMNGSVGASLGMLSHSAAPRLAAAGIAPARATALVALASTLGVIVPPSLVLLLLGDAMMRAHTEALLIAPAAVQVVNNQDVIRAVLLPGALVLAVVVLITLVAGARRGAGPRAAMAAAPIRQRAEAVALTVAVPLLLGAVAAGRIVAVEAAALAGCALMAYGVLSGQLRGAWPAVLDEAMRLTGLVFGLLVGATTFTLVLRGYGTDAWLGQALAALTAGPLSAVALVMGLLLLCAFVLDAFELIFLVVPLVMPPLLARVGDPAWVATLTLLVLQIGFLLPPLGYAVLMAQGAARPAPPMAAVARALVPYLIGLAAVFAAVLTWPALTHWGQPAAVTAPTLNNADVEELMRQGGGRSAPPP